MASNGQDRSNQITDGFMRLAKRHKTVVVDMSVEAQQKRIDENLAKERAQKEADRIRIQKDNEKPMFSGSPEGFKAYLAWKDAQDAK
jgi:hypothetical protein